MADNPETPEEWQAAVDAADFLLLLDATRQYGLVEGGPEVDAERCMEILERGAELGIFPSPPDHRRTGIGRWLRSEREALGLSQRALGERAGLSQPLISMLERGATDCEAATLARLREAIEAIRKEGARDA